MRQGKTGEQIEQVYLIFREAKKIHQQQRIEQLTTKQ